MMEMVLMLSEVCVVLFHSEQQPPEARLYLHSTLVVCYSGLQGCKQLNERENDSCTPLSFSSSSAVISIHIYIRTADFI